MSVEIQAIVKLFESYAGKSFDNIEAMPLSGSNRKYYRLSIQGKTYVAVFNADLKENIAFIEYTKHFLKLGLNVPEIIAEDLHNDVYIIQDLGNSTLLSYISGYDDNNGSIGLSAESIEMYKKVLVQLPIIQVKGGKAVDYSVAYPRHSFDKQSMMWDLNYFKYYFLKLAQIPFDEQKLEDDFQIFCDFLLKADSSHFLYRDFQSRNVMVFNGDPYFIDYQGGRKGALQYDIASILFEAKTSIPPEQREQLLEYYLHELSKQIKFNKIEFVNYYYGYVYIRIMQAMGAYGFRGLYEKKELFLQSIPKALAHLQWLRTNVVLPVQLPELEKVWDCLIQSEYIKSIASKALYLTVTINSFSYKRGIPVDETNSNGGFVFDCRALNNPGRYDEYKNLTGMDKPVKDFLTAEEGVADFLNNIFALISQSIDNYSSRGFKNLMINFGCTGGQHRSVFSAESLNTFIKTKYPHVNTVLRHREIEMKK
jgi:aminoglycoside/choline kinase family phosphotransferase